MWRGGAGKRQVDRGSGINLSPLLLMQERGLGGEVL